MALVGLDFDKATCAATAFRAWAMRLFSAVGNSQSLVKEMMQKRVVEFAECVGQMPP